MAAQYSITNLVGPVLTADVSTPWVPGALIGKYVCMSSGTLATQAFQIVDNGTNWVSLPVTCQGTLNGDLTMSPAGYNWFNGGDGPATHSYYTTGGLFGGRAYLRVWGSGGVASNVYGIYSALPNSGTVTLYIRCRCSGQRTDPWWLSVVGRGFDESINTTGIDDWAWRPYTFTLHPWGYIYLIIGGRAGTYYGNYPDWVEIEVCGVTINGYIDLLDMGFAVNDTFSISNSPICCIDYAPAWSRDIGPAMI
jgi:hypothetical protein